MIFKSRFSSMGNWNFTTKLEFTQYIIWPKFPHVSFHHYFFIYWPNMDSFKTQLNNQTTLNNSPPKTEEIFVRYFWSSAIKGVSVYEPHVVFVAIQEIWKKILLLSIVFKNRHTEFQLFLMSFRLSKQTATLTRIGNKNTHTHLISVT